MASDRHVARDVEAQADDVLALQPHADLLRTLGTDRQTDSGVRQTPTGNGVRQTQTGGVRQTQTAGVRQTQTGGMRQTQTGGVRQVG